MPYVTVLAELFWGHVVPVSLQAALLALAVAIVDRLLPRRAWPELRAGLWALVLLRLLVPPGVASPWSPGGVLPETALFGDAVPRWALAVPAVWLISTGLLAFAVAWRYRAERRRLLAGVDAKAQLPAPLVLAVSRAASRLGVPEPRTVVSREARGPLVMGTFRPVLVLPEGLSEALDQSRLEHVVLHELAHVKRRDALRALFCAAVQMAYWFHPLVWIATRRLGVLRESCCDRTALAYARGESEGYSRALLEVAARVAGERREPGLAFVVPHHSLALRMELIRASDSDVPALRRVTVAAVLGVLAVLAVPLAREAEGASRSVAELVTRPPGCLHLRYMVLERLAREDRQRKEEKK